MMSWDVILGISVNLGTASSSAFVALCAGARLYQLRYTPEAFIRTVEIWLDDAEKTLDALTPDNLQCIERLQEERPDAQSVDALRAMYSECRIRYLDFKTQYQKASFREKLAAKGELYLSMKDLHTTTQRLTKDIQNTTGALRRSPVEEPHALQLGEEFDATELELLRDLGLGLPMPVTTPGQRTQDLPLRSVMDW